MQAFISLLVSFLAAAQFLTAVPLLRARVPTPGDMRRSLLFFPVIGGLLGLALAGLDIGLGHLLPRAASSALLLAFLAALTGALHLDGLMDTFDGLFGGRTLERRLEIMRDSRVGSFGVAALGLMLLVQWSALLDLDKPARAGGLVLALCLSRWCMAAAIRMFPYARSRGAGTPFHSGPVTLSVLGAAVIAAGGSALLFGLGGLTLFGIVTAAALVFGRFISSRIGGLTGDTYGAICEVMTALALLALVAGVDKGWMEPLWWHG